MIKRGYNHNSPIKTIDCIVITAFRQTYKELLNIVIDKEKSLHELCNRCSECEKRHNNFIKAENGGNN
jgi:7-cyano-7-deazaguanine synthase in queuosine biosynthesis